jgi:protein-disulfide isomerase
MNRTALGRAAVFRGRPLALIAFVVTVACASSTRGGPPGAHAAPSPVTPPAAAKKAPAAAGPMITDFPALSPTVDLAALDPAKRAAFEKIVNEEICPCDCPKSFAACLQEGSKCRPAVLLAGWLAKQLDDDVPAEVLTEALTKEIASGFSAKPKIPAIDGYATKGPKNPKWTIVEYADFECQHCKAASPTLETLMQRRKDVKVVFKHFPLSFHPMARSAAIAAEAAGRQGKFWEMHDAVFATQELLDDALLIGHAKALGLDAARFQKDQKDAAVIAKVDDSRKEGQSFGIEATPMFLVNGRPYFLSRTVEGFELRFAMEEARATSTCQ